MAYGAGDASVAVKWKAFFKSQARNPRWLRAGDVVTVGIATPDGRIGLGEQRTRVIDPSDGGVNPATAGAP